MSGLRLPAGARVADLRRAMRNALAAAGIEEVDADARLLAGAALTLSGAALSAAARDPVDPARVAAAEALLARRLGREPMARILGRREFWGLEFALGEETLVPRPETETLVEAALARFPDRGAALRIADLGTGSGAILAALLHEYPRATGVGVDIAAGALAVARANLARHGLAARSLLVRGRWGEALAGGFDLVAGNPPYIATGDIAALEPEVARHEPVAALDGGPDGLAAYRAIAAGLPRLLAPGGVAILELGAGQQPAVERLVVTAGLAPERVFADLLGHPRALVASLGTSPASDQKGLGTTGKSD